MMIMKTLSGFTDGYVSSPVYIVGRGRNRTWILKKNGRQVKRNILEKSLLKKIEFPTSQRSKFIVSNCINMPFKPDKNVSFLPHTLQGGPEKVAKKIIFSQIYTPKEIPTTKVVLLFLITLLETVNLG